MIPAEFVPVANHLWQSTLFAGAAALLTLALRRNQARVRYAIWLAASYKFLIPFSWLVSFGHLFEWHSAPQLVPQAIATVTNVVGTPVFLMPSATVAAAAQPSSLLPAAIWSIWACGFIILTIGWAREWWRIRRMVKRGTRLDFALPIPVVTVSSQLEPGVFGIFQPVLLLPTGIAQRLTPEQLRAVIAHELCHVRRRDNLASAIHMLVEALFWFHPLVWWLDARMIDERERACDEEVLRMGGEPAAYVETILAVCKSYVESPITCMSGISGADLKRRVLNVMANRRIENLGPLRKLLLSALAIIAIIAPILFGILNAASLHAQSSPTDWEKAAGGKMAFDVASVKQTTVRVPNGYSNIPLGSGDAFPPNGGLFSESNKSVAPLISFAYKLDVMQGRDLESQLPAWARSGPNSERFDIQARAPAGTTKDQMRLMMQSLLAERFGLKAHFEHRPHEPAYALVMVKAGKTGPKLQPHSDDTPCPDPSAPAVSGVSLITTPAGYPAICGTPVSMLGPNSAATVAGRNVSMQKIAQGLEIAPNLDVDREVVDQTGLTGNFDFIMKYSSQPLSATNADAGDSGQDFTQALKNQLGLKLQPATAPLDVLIIDHIEQPTPN